jgi:complex iron-sulfur molybdoenzyme family reductase subunit gamma
MMVRILSRHRALAATAAILLSAAALQFFNANPAASQTVWLVAYESPDNPGVDPASDAWNRAIAIQVPLTAQGAGYPLGGGSIPVVAAKALHHNNKLYLRVEWDDATKDESTTRVQDFSDAVAVEFPAKSATSVPALCMGQADAGVNIWHWRADSQVGPKDPAQVYANASIDTYNADAVIDGRRLTDSLFYTARAAGNPYAQVDRGPVQTLISQTFGTLTAASVQNVGGQGVYTNGKWAVVFEREYEAKNAEQAVFGDGAQTEMAFAIWNGSEGDRNGQKSVSSFVTLSVANAPLPGGREVNTTALVWAGILLVGVCGIGVGLGWVGYRQAQR